MFIAIDAAADDSFCKLGTFKFGDRCAREWLLLGCVCTNKWDNCCCWC